MNDQNNKNNTYANDYFLNLVITFDSFIHSFT